MNKLLMMVILATGTNALAQGNIQPSDFVIDHSQPYVYLKFDHIGPRRSYAEGEGNTGIWIRFVNNCRIPIVFMGEPAAAGAPGVLIGDEVLPVQRSLQVIVDTPQKTETKKQPTKQSAGQKPAPYVFENYSTETVEPGDELLFTM